MSCLESPHLITKNVFNQDVNERALEMLNSGYGAYTHSQGLPSIRNDIAEFIQGNKLIRM